MCSRNTVLMSVLMGVVDVPPPDAPLTFYVRHGDLFAKACSGVTVLVLLLLPWLGRKRPAPHPPVAAQTSPHLHEAFLAQ